MQGLNLRPLPCEGSQATDALRFHWGINALMSWKRHESRPDRTGIAQGTEMGIASCYSMDLYCDNLKVADPLAVAETPADGVHYFNEFPHQYIGETFGECARQARDAGWLFRRDRVTVLCPKCSGKNPGAAAS